MESEGGDPGDACRCEGHRRTGKRENGERGMTNEEGERRRAQHSARWKGRPAKCQGDYGKKEQVLSSHQNKIYIRGLDEKISLRGHCLWMMSRTTG
jgi:hypothetical protein